jgi:hypothetical protein
MPFPVRQPALRAIIEVFILFSLLLLVTTPGSITYAQEGRPIFPSQRLINSGYEHISGILPAPLITTTLTTFMPVIIKAPVNLYSLISKTDLSLPHPLEGMGGNWCTWSYCTLSPRLYQEPLDADQTLVGWTDSSGNGHVSLINQTNITRTDNFAGLSVHGLVVHSTGNYAVLLWNPSTNTMWLSSRYANGNEIWKTNLNSSIAHADFDVGDSRLAYGNGLYAAYFTVYGVSGGFTGHNGDQLSYINDNGTIQSGGWSWGCSHSMAELIGYHPDLQKFIPVCSSDCYASKGILIQDSKVIYHCDGNCGGLVSAQLGQVASSTGGWKLIFNALNRPTVTGKGIGLASIDSSFQSSYIWLTNTQGDYERDPVLAHIGSDLGLDRYLAGWTTTNDGKYWLSVIDGEGNYKLGPENVASSGVKWGNRDDSFRTRPDGSISWVQGDAGSNVLHYFRFNGLGFIP